MKTLAHLLENNRAWAEQIAAADPEFFWKLSQQQAPRYFWIGCSDSRVAANQIVGLLPGQTFVHRNVGNIVPAADLNCLSALQFAVDVLHVEHVIVCGHYGCGAIRAVWRGERLGLVDDWLEPIREVRRKRAELLATCGDESRQMDRLCELNVIEQVTSVCVAAAVQHAWDRGHRLSVHGWIYAVRDGLLRDLGVTVNGSSEVAVACAAASRRAADGSPWTEPVADDF